MISYNNAAPKAVNNVGQFGATEGSIGAYKSAAEYAADAKYWALLSQTKYSSVEEILAEVERLYVQGRLLEEDINQLKNDFEAQEQTLLGLIQSTGTAIDNANAATELSKEATQQVLAQLDIISNMTVQTTLLPPGSLATGSYDNATGVFSFGIPEGKPGRDGTDGTISDIEDVAIGVPVSDDYSFYVDKENGGLYRASISDIANLVPSIRSISINGGEEQTGAVSFNSVSSFNSRTGDVVSEVGDYSVEQITGAAKSGANSDITSLSGLTTALSVSQGGTGASTPEASRTNLGLGSVSVEDIVPLIKGGTGATTPSAARTNLGLGLVSTESIVPVTKGGTGSSSAENARLALVSAKSGDNYDITSLNNLTTALSIEQGGTGVDNQAALWNAIRPTGPTPLSADPVSNMDATTKQWVSSELSTLSTSINTAIASSSLKDIAIAYNLNESVGALWQTGASSTSDKWWIYGNSVYTGITGALPSSPPATAYKIPPFARRDFVSVMDFGASGSRTSTLDDAPAFAAAIAYLKTLGGGTLIIPPGIYDVYSPISLVGTRIVLQGAGRDITNIRAQAVMPNVIDVGEAWESPQANLPCLINDLGVIGNNLAERCLTHIDRHNMFVSGCQFSGATVTNLYALRTWLSAYTDCSFAAGNGHNVYLAGTNHRMKFTSCNFGSTMNGKYCVYATNDVTKNNLDVDTLNEYTKALVFDNCDIEYTDTSGGKGIFLNVLEASFNNCYIGEFIRGTVMDVIRGLVTVKGGIWYYGAVPGAYGINAAGGVTHFENVLLRPHDTTSQMYIDTLVTGTNGKVSFEKCNISRDDIAGLTVPDILNGRTVPSDLFLTIPSPTGSLVPRMGSLYAAPTLNATVTNSSGVDGSRTFTTTDISTAPNKAAFTANLISKQCVPGNLLVGVVYSSNVSLQVVIENSPFAEGGTVLGTLPPTNGVKRTGFVSFSNPSSVLPTGNILRIGGDTAVGNTATLYKIFLTDSLAFNGVSGINTYKNIGLF